MREFQTEANQMPVEA